MQTILKCATTTVTIDTDGPFTIIGEKINPTGRKNLAAQLKIRNFDYVRDLALKQVALGTDLLDVNTGVPGEDEVALLPEVCQVVMSAMATWWPVIDMKDRHREILFSHYTRTMNEGGKNNATRNVTQQTRLQ